MSESPTQAPTYEKRSRSKTPLVVSIIVVFALVIAAVLYFTLGRQTAPAETSKDISVGLVLEPTSLDVRTNAGVATGQILIDNVYQGLVGIEPGTVADIVPVLADGMPEVSDDGLVYTFTVRDGVSFHSGSDLTTTDVVDSLSTTLITENVGFDAEVAEAGDNQVTVTLTEPNSMLLWHLANTPGLILETAATNDLQNTANGTGPFVFSQWKQGDSITLDKFAGYWGDAASIDSATFRFFPEGRAAVNALKDGDIDVHTALLSPLRAEFEGNADFEMVRASGTDVFTLGYNNAKAPFDDVRVRKALSMAIDGDALVATQNGDAKALGSPITEGEPGYTDLTSVNAYDPEAARQLLADAGQQNLSLTITVPNFYDSTSLDLVTSQFAEIGVSAKVNPVEFPTWLSEVYTNHDFDLSYVDHAEARDFGNYTRDGYYFGYSNPEVNELYADALRSTDPAQEDALLQQAATLVAEDAPAKWLFNYTPTNVVSSNVSGFPEVNTNSRVNLSGVSVG
ncbi:MAG: ABC transporter substrate-binding protein [Leucobacter sp.]